MPDRKPHPDQPRRRRGGQPGNLNALKSGGRSAQLRHVIEGLAANPEVRRLLAGLRRTARRQTNRKNGEIRTYNPPFIFPFSQTNPPGLRLGPLARASCLAPPGSWFPLPGSLPYTEVVTRIILFDVDMTLLYSGGAGSLAMRRAFEQLYGIEDGFRRVEFSGRTDWAIVRMAMQQHNLLDGRDFLAELRRFQDAYYELLKETLHEADGGRVMPGVPELLDALSERDEARLGLATGNFRRAAFMKLRHFGLDGHLHEGCFGDDAEDRGELVGVAIRRVADGARVDSASVWVIGDTPLDVNAAHANGARALAVATGPLSADELRAAGADLALDDLSDTDAVLAALLD